MSETNHDHQENGFRPGVASSETVRASAHRRSSYSLFGCVPAEPNSASLDKIIVPNQIIKLRLEFLRGIYQRNLSENQRLHMCPELVT
jgi:hypothetical protein